MTENDQAGHQTATKPENNEVELQTITKSEDDAAGFQTTLAFENDEVYVCIICSNYLLLLNDSNICPHCAVWGNPVGIDTFWEGHTSAASSLLSTHSLRRFIENIEDTQERAWTQSEETSLYMTKVNTIYPIFTEENMNILSQEVSQAAGTSGLVSSVKKALIHWICALGSLQRGTSSAQQNRWAHFLDPKAYHAAAATEIIGTHVGTSICHVQAYLLASIYHRQMSHEAESYSYILRAAGAIRVLLADGNTTWEGTILAAFWVQRLLERQLLSEQHFWKSGLQLLECHVPISEDVSLHAQIALQSLGSDIAQFQTTPILAYDDTEKLQQLQYDNFAFECRLSLIWPLNVVLAEHSTLRPLAICMNAKATSILIQLRRPFLDLILHKSIELFAEIPEIVIDGAKCCVELMRDFVVESSLIQDDPYIKHHQWASAMMLLLTSIDDNTKSFVEYKAVLHLAMGTRNNLMAGWFSSLNLRYVTILDNTVHEAELRFERRSQEAF